MDTSQFEPLREMEAFTLAMLNRIIAFQEKEHPAWDEGRPFRERIADLPLHALVFSNPDRDPATQGPTVAHYFPLRREMLTLAAYLRQLSEAPKVLDLHPRNGFIASLLTLEDEAIRVDALRDPACKPSQIERFHTEAVRFLDQTLEEYEGEVDLALSSWMPPGQDPTPHLARLRPKLVAYVFTDHVNEETGERQTGSDGAFGENLPEGYRLIDQWEVTRREDLFHGIWPDLTPCPKEVRQVRLYADAPYHGLTRPEIPEDHPPYDWEHELAMAELAHRAKEHLRALGHPV